MPYEKISDAPANFRRLRPTQNAEKIPLALAQVNWIANMADGIKRGNPNVDNPFAVAIANFKRLYEVKDGKWVKKEKADMEEAMRFGQRLADMLNMRIDSMATDDRPRARIIEEMGMAADITAGTVNQILNGSVNCPPMERLEGFARVLNVSVERLRQAAESDGCSYRMEMRQQENACRSGTERPMYTSRHPLLATVPTALTIVGGQFLFADADLFDFRAIPRHETPFNVGRAWDADAAEGRVRRWASSDGSGNRDTIDWVKYGTAFAWVDGENREAFGAYKLGHHDVIDGRLTLIWNGLRAAGAAVQGARGGVDIPSADMDGVRAHLAGHYRQLDRTPPWET